MRIDHFRGFEGYYAIPAGQQQPVTVCGARARAWNCSMRCAAPWDLPIIAEDLGFLTDGVHRLLAESGFPGMKVLQFAFDSREDERLSAPQLPRHRVVYTGTHDNDTMNGWMHTASPEDVRFAWEYLRLTKAEGPNWGMMRGAAKPW